MKTSNVRRTLSAALAGLALVAIAHASYAAADVASETQIAGLMGTARATAPAESPSGGRGSPFTLYAKDPNGNAFRLVRVKGGAWRYAEGWKSPDRAGKWLFRNTGFGSTPAPAANKAVLDEEPLSVFIDGPSGFMFVWNRDGGWKFVGTVADRGP